MITCETAWNLSGLVQPALKNSLKPKTSFLIFNFFCISRNFELEQKFADLTRVNIEQQQVERNLRDELSNCVTKAVSNADRKK